MSKLYQDAKNWIVMGEQKKMKVRFLIFAAHLVFAGVSESAVAQACGFDNPQAIALGTLNLNYPDAASVLAAVWRAEDAGLLMPTRGRADGKGPLAFYRAAAGVKQFGTNLTDALATGNGMAISVVLIPQVMWTRFGVGPEGPAVQSHAEGAQADDLVIVTEEKVVQGLVSGALDPQAAEGNGLLRFYGDPAEIASVRAALARSAGPLSAGTRR